MIDGIFEHQDSIGGGRDRQRRHPVDDRRAGILHIERPPSPWWRAGPLPRHPAVGQPACADKMVVRATGHRSQAAALVASSDGGTLVRIIPARLTAMRARPHTHAHRPGPCDAQPGARLELRGRATTTPRLRARRQRHGGSDAGRSAWASWPSTAPATRCSSRPTPRRSPARRAWTCSSSWPAHQRAGGRLRPVRDEHQGRARPGVRGLPAGASAASRPSTSASRSARGAGAGWDRATSVT